MKSNQKQKNVVNTTAHILNGNGIKSEINSPLLANEII